MAAVATATSCGRRPHGTRARHTRTPNPHAANREPTPAATICHDMPRYVTICHDMSRHVTICVIEHNAPMPRQIAMSAILHDLTRSLRCVAMDTIVAMSRYATICHDMSRHVTIRCDLRDRTRCADATTDCDECDLTRSVQCDDLDHNSTVYSSRSWLS